MLIFVLDDEALLLKASERSVREAVPDAEVIGFGSAQEAIAALEAGKRPDAVFCDIVMPGMSGLEFALQLKNISPDSRIVFVTGFSKYAVDSYRMHAHGYVMKPLEPKRVLEELEGLPAFEKPGAEEKAEEQAPAEKLQVRCFGSFEVFWKGEPVMFRRRKTRELLAYLVNAEGAFCLAEEVIAAIWEDAGNMINAKNLLRVHINDLTSTLAHIGQSDVIIRRSGKAAVRRDLIDCDYYNFLAGDPEAVNAYRGEYMNQYSWAELTAARLQFGN